jgi:tetratricopeptide (TPR) repeat protein
MRRPIASVLLSAIAPSFVLGASLALAPTASAQDLSATRISDQIEYARGLASSWQFLDLADAVLNGLEGADLSGEQREALALTRADVFAAGARTIGDDSLREGLFNQALDSYSAFLDSYPASALVAEAQRNYIGVARDYSTHMSDLVEEAAGDEQGRLRSAIEERVARVLSNASEAIAKYEDISDRTESQENQLWNMRLDRGRLLLTLGRASKDGDGYLTLAEDEMGEVAFFAPTDSSFPQQAFMVLGEVYLAKGQIADAADTFEYVAENSIPFERATWMDLREYLNDPQKNFRWSYLEFVTPPMIEAHMQAGNTARAAGAGLHLLNMQNLEGFEVSARGELAMVAAARALFDAGGVVGGTPSAADYSWFQTEEEAEAKGFGKRSMRPALELALTLALDQSEGSNSLAGARAKGLINDLIESPGLNFGPDVLMQAAKGAYDARDYEAALSAFRRVLTAVQGDPINSSLFGGEVCWYMGDTYRRQGRLLEAAMAHREGVVSYAGNQTRDGQNAKAAYDQFGRFMRVDPESKLFKEMQQELAALVQIHVKAGETDVIYDLAKQKYAEAESNGRPATYGEAAGRYAEVPESSKYYGVARSMVGLCYYKAGDLAKASESFAAFEDELATTADAAVRSQLEGAHARVRFFGGEVALDRKIWSKALETFASFPKDFPDEAEFHDSALAKAVRAAVELGQIDRALELMGQLSSRYPDSSQTLAATGYLFTPLWETYRTTETGSAERTAVLEPLSTVVELRNRLSKKASFDLLRIESKLWIELGRFEDALATLERINKVFADDETQAEKLDTFVKPDLGVVYIQLDRLPEAHGILAPLVPDPDDKTAKSPSGDVVEAYIKSVAGWMKGTGSDPEVMSGIGGAAELEKAYKWATKRSGNSALDAYTPPWFDARFLELWTLYQWSKVDTQHQANLRQILVTFKRDYGNDFEFMTESGCDPSVASRFRWLDRLAK